MRSGGCECSGGQGRNGEDGQNNNERAFQLAEETATSVSERGSLEGLAHCTGGLHLSDSMAA